MIRTMGLLIRFLLIVGAAAFAILFLLVARGILVLGPNMIVLLAVGQATCTSAEPVRALVLTWRKPKRQRFHADLSRVLQQGAFRIGQKAGNGVQRLGLSVYEIPGWPRSRRALKRLQRHRFDDHPLPSQIRWTIGKGIVGKCWKEQTPVYRDLRAVAADARGRGLTGLNPELIPDRGWNMKFDELARILGKYAEVYAMPINGANGKMIGVLVVDIPYDGRTNGTSRLNQPAVEKAIASVAVLAGSLLS